MVNGVADAVCDTERAFEEVRNELASQLAAYDDKGFIKRVWVGKPTLQRILQDQMPADRPGRTLYRLFWDTLKNYQGKIPDGKPEEYAAQLADVCNQMNDVVGASVAAQPPAVSDEDLIATHSLLLGSSFALPYGAWDHYRWGLASYADAARAHRKWGSDRTVARWKEGLEALSAGGGSAEELEQQCEDAGLNAFEADFCGGC